MVLCGMFKVMFCPFWRFAPQFLERNEPLHLDVSFSDLARHWCRTYWGVWHPSKVAREQVIIFCSTCCWVHREVQLKFGQIRWSLIETETKKKFLDNDENLEDYMNCNFFMEHVPYWYFHQQIAWCIWSYRRILNASYKLILAC